MDNLLFLLASENFDLENIKKIKNDMNINHDLLQSILRNNILDKNFLSNILFLKSQNNDLFFRFDFLKACFPIEKNDGEDFKFQLYLTDQEVIFKRYIKNFYFSIDFSNEQLNFISQEINKCYKLIKDSLNYEEYIQKKIFGFFIQRIQN